VLVLIALFLLKWFSFNRLMKLALRTRTDLDDLIISLLKQTRSLFIVILSIYITSLVLSLPEEVRQPLRTFTIMALLLQIGFWGTTVINFLVKRYTHLQMEKDPTEHIDLRVFGLISKVFLWTLVGLLILDNIPGVQVTSLIASLGIGGIAVALAIQNILGDLFASLSITLDKPFVVGDTIRVGDMTGSVENIGLKSTRVRSVDGQQLVFSNNDLLNSRIENLKRMERRRIVFTIGVTYGIPYAKLVAIPGMIQDIVIAHDYVTFDRAHFSNYGDFAITFEAQYYMDTADFQTYMDTQQSIYLKLYQKFEGEGIDFAYPTQTIYLEK
jgi:small-conductance mechanosensitive channel